MNSHGSGSSPSPYKDFPGGTFLLIILSKLLSPFDSMVLYSIFPLYEKLFIVIIMMTGTTSITTLCSSENYDGKVNIFERTIAFRKWEEIVILIKSVVLVRDIKPSIGPSI